MVFKCIIKIFGDVSLGNAKESAKTMLVEKNIACHIVQKVLYQIQNYQKGLLKNMTPSLNYNS